MRKFFTHFVFAILFSCIAHSSLSQANGDYRSIASGNWATSTTWERFNGSTWVAAAVAPSSSDNVITIRSPHSVIVNGTITVDQVVVASGGILTLPSATLNLNDGAGDDLVINGTMNFNEGTLGGTAGTVLISSTGTLLLSTGLVKSTNTGITITNNGTITWQEGGLNFSAAVVNNNIFNISASALWQFSGGLTNTGTINKTAGSTTISTPWSNSGTINLSGGSLNSSLPFTNSGTITFTNNAAWQNSSTFNHNTGSVVSGTGSFSNSGTLTLNINQVFPATLVFSNSNTINGNGNLTVNNDMVIQGQIVGSGAFTLNGNGDFQSGTLGRSLTISAGRTLLLSTASVKTTNVEATITNNGTMSWQEGGINGGGAFINNNIFNISASALWQFSGGFTNTGTINKTAGGTHISTPWSNSGTINFSGGSLNSSLPFTNSGTITFTNNTVWQNSSTFNHNTGSVVSGNGSFSNSGTLTLNINQVFPATLVFSNSNLINGNGNLTVNNDFVIQGNITGSGAFTLNGNGDFQAGTLGRSLTIAAGRTLLLSTASVKTTNVEATITNNGTMSWTEGGINGGGAFINNNVFNISASALWQFSGGLTNNGTINKTGTVTTNLNTPVINSSTGIIKGIGIILFSSTIANSGSIAPGLSPGILIVDGVQPFSVNSTLSIEIAGNGGVGNPTGHDQLQRGSDLILNGILTVVETGTVPDGDYTIILLSAGTITGTFPSTNLPANYSVVYNSNNVVVRKGSVCPPSVSIAANPGNTICSGTNVTFTATPTNGGTPSYQWKLNGNNVGTNSNTYSNNALANGNVVTVVMTSSLACASPTTATSNGITMAVTSTVAPVVGASVSTGSTICSGTNVTFTAFPTNGGATPSYQWKLNGNNVGTNSNTYSNNTLVNNDVVTVVMTSSLTCASPSTASSVPVSMTVNPTVASSVSISANPGNSICSGTNVIFTATPTNGGTPAYQWKLNGNNVGTNSNTYSNNALTNGDIVTVVMTSSLACASPTTATSTGITMTVTSTVTPSVSIAANPGNTICAGTNVTFTATPTNGGTPSYQWKLNGNNVGTNSNTYSNNALANGDIVTVVMTSSLACASPTTATSTGITMTVTSTVAAIVGASVSTGSTICSGTNVTFTAFPTNGGPTPAYQWKLNGNNVGTNSNTYSNNTLANNDVVTVVMTSSLACASPSTASSVPVSMTVNPTVASSVSISANPGNSICSGTNVTFTSSPTNGGTPSYQWKLNGNNVGTNSNTYSNNTLANGDVVTVAMTSSLTCANPATATSNGITMSVNSTVAPVVGASVSTGSTICFGTNVTFTAFPTNGGATPSYQWKLNGNNVGTNSNTYSNNTLVNNDVVTVVMTSSLACASPSTASSVPVSMTVTSTVSPSVGIAANPGNTICAGTNVTFTAIPTNGGTPSYQWKLNGGNVGTNSNTYSNSSLANGDVVTVVMTSSLACASPTTATSNGITMVVTATVAPLVSIAANPGNTICAGTNVTFTATPTNGGTPSYQWKLNGNNVGTNSNTYSNNTLANGNIVTVVMTSSIACVSPTTATSTGITMIVTVLTNYYRDQDGDTYGNATVIQQACTAPVGYVSNSTDCDDNNNAINPAAAEVCGNSIDDNCNGQIDENCTTEFPILQTRTYAVKEGDNGISQYDLEVKLDRPAVSQVRITYSTSDDEARAGVDYSPASGVLVIPQGSSSGIIRVSIIGDLLRENNERFRIIFSNPVNVTINGDAYSRVMIIDDDKGKLGTILRRGQPWRVPIYANKLDEVSIFSQQGAPVYKASNVNNNISLGKLSAGTYHYLVKAKDENNVLKEYSGVIVIMD